jgi:hypothetical protein
LLSDTTVDGYLIFEDDVTPTAEFVSKLTRSFTILKHRQVVADLVFFTTCLKNKNHRFREEGVIKKSSRLEINVDSIGGTGCYYISKKAAMAVFDYIERHTLDVAIDALLFNVCHLVETYFVQPCIISQEDIIGISNIQHDHGVLSPLYCENPVIDDKIVYNDKSDIDLFDHIYYRSIVGDAGAFGAVPTNENGDVDDGVIVKKLSEIYIGSFKYLNEKCNSPSVDESSNSD